MLIKTRVASIAALAAAGVVMTGSPAFAWGDDDTVGIGNQSNVSVLPVQSCASNVSAGVLAFAIPVLSPQETGDCTNAPQVNVGNHHQDGDVVGILNQANISLVPIQLCSTNLAAGLGVANVPILSPQETGDCTNAPQIR